MKRKRERKSTTPESRPVVSAPAPLGPGQITLGALALRELFYRELPLGPGHQIPVAIPGAQLPIETTFTGQLGLAPGALVAELTLRGTVAFEKNVRPIQLEAVLTAQFHRAPELPLRAFLEFLSRSGGMMLFPYFRELVSSVTSRGVFGTFLLNPTAIGPILSLEQVDQIVTEQGHKK